MPRVLLLATTTGYQTRAFGEAAERLGVELVFATDRCHLLEDPWRDGAIPIRFHDEDASVAAILERPRARPIDGVLASAIGRRSSRRASREALGLPWHPPAGGRDRAQQAAHARAAARRRSAGAVVRRDADRRRSPRSLDPQCPFPVRRQAGGAVGQPRRDARRRCRASFVAAFDRLRALLRSPDVRAERNDAHDAAIVEGFIPGREFALEGAAASRRAARAGDLRQARSARRSVLRRDDLRDAVVGARAPSSGDRRGDRPRRPRRSVCGTGRSTPSAA